VAIGLQEDNLSLREQVKTLTEKLNLKGKMTFHQPYYYMNGDSKPFCAKCWKHCENAIHLLGDGGGQTECWNYPACKQVYERYQ